MSNMSEQSDHPQPVPSLAIRVAFVVTVVACFFLLGCAILAFTGTNPYAILGGVMLLPVCAVAGLIQFRAVVRRQESFAFLASCGFWAVAFMSLFALASNFVEGWKAHSLGEPIFWLVFGTICIFISAVSSYFAIIYYRW